jgi:hypothetical protein
MPNTKNLPSETIRSPRYLVLGRPECKESGQKVRLAGIGEGVVSVLTLVPAFTFFLVLQSFGWLVAAAGGLLLVLCLYPVLQLLVGRSTGWVLVGTPAAEASARASRRFVRSVVFAMLLLWGVFWLLSP